MKELVRQVASLAGGVIAFVSLWIAPVLVAAGLAVCVAASVWDFLGVRRHSAQRGGRA
ncbi:MAG: hypothetical protein M5U08_22095 [Burkholderiales bacterium]|nr:hypothetical protein [Burkholderiales bacterium]